MIKNNNRQYNAGDEAGNDFNMAHELQSIKLINESEMRQTMKLRSIKGFSLIELLIVIAIMTILTTIATPAFNKLRYNTQLKDVAREISGNIQLYRQKAMTENTNYLVYLYDSGQNIRCYFYVTPTPTPPTWNWSNRGNKIIETNGFVTFSTTPYFHVVFGGFNFYAPYVIFIQRGNLPIGGDDPVNSIKLKHLKTNSTATIHVSVMGKVTVTYDLK